jgi:bis(5'-nucleosyl)-tetraphosphatase (symmetrical)
MATYAIGDVQGCYDELRALLDRLAFDRARDRLWFVGDLVNRGPKSLEVLRFVRELGERAIVVLGNHDLHLVCIYEGLEQPRASDTLDAVLAAPDARALVDWLRGRPLIHVGPAHAMVHAGLLPQWTMRKAQRLAAEVETALRASDYRAFLQNMYGGTPNRWDDALVGWDRLRVVVNAMTRLRFCTRDGKMDLRAKGLAPPRGMRPWYEARPARREPSIVFGHWSALGLKLTRRLAALDSGCVWGGALSALKLEDRRLVQVGCRGYQLLGTP